MDYLPKFVKLFIVEPMDHDGAKLDRIANAKDERGSNF